MSPKTCPRCGQPASGNFCASCGAALTVKACPTCGAPPEPGSRFCTRCGTALTEAARVAATAPATGPQRRAGAGGGDPHMGWWVAGGLMVVLILVVAWPILQREPAPAMGGAAATGTAAGNPAAGPSAVDLSTMSPREAADRLFDRVMRTAAAGDSATAISFVPMTVSAYDQARPLDADGLFHLASVQRVAGDHAAALAAAQEALEGDPDHLLALHAAAQAAVDLGDTATALTYYRHVLEVWDAEMGSGLFDYEAHASMMDEVRRTAQAFVAGNGG